MARRFVPSGDYPYLRGDVGYGKTISASEIQSQFSDTGSVSWSELYKGGDIVSNTDGAYLLGSNAQEVPSSGKISVSDFLVKPFWDQTYYCSSVGTTTTHTFTVPANRGYNNMRIFIQGAGGSGAYGPPVSGVHWGSGYTGSVFPRPVMGGGGGNGGGYATKNSVAITDNDVITIYVGAGGSVAEGTYSSTGVNGSRGTRGTGERANGSTSYVQVNGTTVLSVAGGNSPTGYVLQSRYDSGSGSTSTFSTAGWSTPDTGTSGLGGSDLYRPGGQGKIGFCKQAYAYHTGIAVKDRGYYLYRSVFGEGGSAGGAYGTAAQGSGYVWSGAFNNTFDLGYYASGVQTGVNNVFTRSTSYQYGKGGNGWYSNIDGIYGVNGGDGFVRIMFYDKDWPIHQAASTFAANTPVFT